MSARWFTFLVWAAVAATGLYWGLKLLVKPQAAPPQAQVADTGGAPRGDLTRLLGVDAAPVAAAALLEPAPDARFSLIGVVSPRAKQAASEGVALIAVDGKPPKAFRVGAVVEGQNVLQSVHARGAALGPRGGPALVALQMNPPAPASTGTLPPPQSQMGGPGMPQRNPGVAPPPMPVMTPPPGGPIGVPLPVPPVNLAPQAPTREGSTFR